MSIAFAHLACPARTHLVPERHGFFALVLDAAGEIAAEGWSDRCPWDAAARAIAAWRGKQ